MFSNLLLAVFERRLQPIIPDLEAVRMFRYVVFERLFKDCESPLNKGYKLLEAFSSVFLHIDEREARRREAAIPRPGIKLRQSRVLAIFSMFTKRTAAVQFGAL